MANTCKQTKKSKRRASKAGLKYVNDFADGISRRRCGRGFTYLLPTGRTLRSKRIRSRIEDLVVPPAWEDVWISPDSKGHIQARGRDQAGRVQYIYHEHWLAVSKATKFDRMARVAEVLPRIRRRVRKDLNCNSVTRERVLAAVLRLIDKANLRIGNNQSVKARGATTLEAEHVSLDQFRVSLEFPSKSGQRREVEFSDQKVAKVIRGCEELDGQYLFCYEVESAEPRRVDSTDVNEYLREIADEEVSAKDFRTWWGSVTALSQLKNLTDEATSAQRKSACRAAVRRASCALGNSVAVCRKSYVHPGLLSAAKSGELPCMIADVEAVSISELSQDEVLFKGLLPQLDFT